MPVISTGLRVILWVVATVSGVFAAVFGNVLAINIVYFFTRRGRRPTKRPPYIWFLFFLSASISVVLGALAAFAPTSHENQISTPVAPTVASLNYIFSVPAVSTGYSTGLLVHQGDILVFSATGIWCWGGGTDCSSADGTPGRPKPDEGLPTLANEYYGKLIGRVDNWLFPIGISNEVKILTDGELVLLMNDSNPNDNSGTITVQLFKK